MKQDLQIGSDDRNYQDELLSELEELYKVCENEFIRMNRKKGFSITELTNAYGEAVRIVYEKIVKEKKRGEETYMRTMKGYLLTTAWNRLLSSKRKESKQYEVHKQHIIDNEELILVEEKIDSNEQIEKILSALDTLGKKCQEILSLFLFEGYDLEEITQIMSYSGTNTTKSTLHRCREDIKARLGLK